MICRELTENSALTGCSFVGASFATLAIPEFVETFGCGGIDIEKGLYLLEKGKENNIIPEIKPEIISNSRAVFLTETHISVPRDERDFILKHSLNLKNRERICERQFYKW